MPVTRSALGGFMLGTLLSTATIGVPATLGQMLPSGQGTGVPSVDQLEECAPSESATVGPETNPPVATGEPSSQTSGTFQLCGVDDPELERAIERLIAGRNFSVSLRGRGDGCAELAVNVTSDAPGRGRQNSIMKVSVGAGRSVDLTIASENGRTHVSIRGS